MIVIKVLTIWFKSKNDIYVRFIS